MNGISISDPEGKLYDAMILLGSGKLGKSEFAQILRNLKKKYS
jgi:death-on-curing protein